MVLARSEGVMLFFFSFFDEQGIVNDMESTRSIEPGVMGV